MKRTLRNFLTGTTPKAPAARPRAVPLTKRAVWRISEAAPMGEWVDPDTQPEPTPGARKPQPEAASSGWLESSTDLLNGTDVSESHDTSPDDLFDELNARPRPPKCD